MEKLFVVVQKCGVSDKGCLTFSFEHRIRGGAPYVVVAAFCK